MKIRWKQIVSFALALALGLGLAACGDSGDAAGEDWRTTGVVVGSGTITHDGDSVDVLVTADPNSAAFYWDQEEQVLFDSVAFPETIEDISSSAFQISFDDQNGDGESDVLVEIGHEDMSNTTMLWLWDPQERYVYQPEYSSFHVPGVVEPEESIDSYVGLWEYQGENLWLRIREDATWEFVNDQEDVIESGTGTAAQIANMTVAGKTGTTTSDFDRWFAGYTPYYTGVVWCGYDDPEEVVLTDSSTNPAIVLWQKVMEQVHDGLANKEFNKPTNVVECTVCRDSGLLMTDACREDPRGSRAVTVELSLYDVPTQNCDVHKEVEICGASGHVVNEYCKQVEGNTTKTVGLLDVSRAFPVRGITVQDQAYAVPNDSLPAGYYPALSPDVDAINVECYIHTRDDLPEPEAPEDEEEEDSASRISAAVRDILTGGSHND